MASDAIGVPAARVAVDAEARVVRALRDSRLVAVLLGAGLVLSVGLTDGGYYARSWTLLTVAALALGALGALAWPDSRPARPALTILGTLVAFGCWTAVSSTWALPGSLAGIEARRLVLYAVVLAAILLVSRPGGRAALLGGLLAGTTVIGAVAVAIRSLAPGHLDRFYGSLASEPIGYPNALGIVCALGAIVACGLTQTPAIPHRRSLRAAGALLVVVLGLTESRGAELALALGLALLVVVSGRRGAVFAEALVTTVAGVSGWLVADALSSKTGGVAVGAALAVVAAAVVPARELTPSRRLVCALAAGLVLAGGATVAVAAPSSSSSFRTAYWAAALAGAADHPLLGSGAGSFRLVWHEHRHVETETRDAHSLYLETLAELGPLGLALVLAFVAGPLVVAVRRRSDPLVATAGSAFAAFAVHAGVDWDWEMPVVAFVALGLIGVIAGGTTTRAATAVGRQTGRIHGPERGEGWR
ncbi:MAG: O-antigen ligase family protein [Gaiellales bacterium]